MTSCGYNPFFPHGSQLSRTHLIDLECGVVVSPLVLDRALPVAAVRLGGVLIRERDGQDFLACET